MPKIKNWSVKEKTVHYGLVHDETGDSIEVGASRGSEYRSDGCPKEYQITLWSRDHTNNRVLTLTYNSKEKAKEKVREYARNHPDGKLVKTKNEEFNFMEWGEEMES